MKKYIDKLKELKSTNKKLFVGVVSLLLLVGVTFAYVAAQISGGALKLLNLGAQATDQLEFVVDKELSIRATQENFTAGGNNLSDTAIATAKLKANSTNNTANYTYNVYLMIDQNEFKYTTTDKKTEVLLQVTDPNGNSITELDGLTYDNTLQGFDITEATELVTIASNYAITSSSSSNYTTQNWTFTITFINLDTNQKENAGKELTGQIIIQRNKMNYGDVMFVINNYENKYGADITNLNCNKSGVIYDFKNKDYLISNFNDRIKCTVNYERPITKQYLNQYIIELSGTTQGTGKVINEPTTDYRYEGKNPNNWIWFNNELWRIIGVFDTNTHNQTDDSSTVTKENQLVKIIRNDSIGVLTWNRNIKNDWQNSTLYKLLNPVDGDTSSGSYYNKKNGNGSDYCYYNNTIKGICNYTNLGIDSSYRNMIKNVTWKVGGFDTKDAIVSDYYAAERGSITGNNNAYAKEVLGYIGLMYPSDVGYSALASNCNRTSNNLSSYASSDCASQSWLVGKGLEWTITPNVTSTNNVFFLYGRGYINVSTAYSGRSIRPAIYLNSNVYIVNGTGTEMDPYIVSI